MLTPEFGDRILPHGRKRALWVLRIRKDFTGTTDEAGRAVKEKVVDAGTRTDMKEWDRADRRGDPRVRASVPLADLQYRDGRWKQVTVQGELLPEQVGLFHA